MANFFETYNGDVLSLNYIAPTIETKSIWIPGKTCAFDVEVSGETAYYYTSETLDISKGAAGRKLDLNATGAKRKSFDLVTSYGIGGVIPLVGHATVSEDLIGRKLMDSTAAVIGMDNKEGLDQMLATTGVKTATAVSALTADNIYGDVIDSIVEFNKNNAFAIDANGKATGGFTAKTLIVGPSVYGLLQKAPEFVQWSAGQTQFSLNEASVGRIAGLDVFYSSELDETKAKYIVMNPDGWLAPKGVSATELFDKVEGRPGAIIAQSEVVYGFHAINPTEILLRKVTA